jgi:hypothetical protein
MVMQALTNAVGDGSVNVVHDAALVQAILFACRRPALLDPARSRYLAAIDGSFGNGSKTALRLFQNENVFVNAQGNQSVPNPNATAGLVRAGDATWQAMLRLVDPAFANLRVLPNSKVPYIEAPAATLNANIGLAQQESFQATFTPKVAQLLRSMHSDNGIALSVCRQGGRRTFQEQYALLTGGNNVTNAGPGESNHNYGQAADIGFKGLRWIRPNGTIEENETCWLHKLEAQPAGATKALVFWEKMRAVGTAPPVSLHRGPQGDRPHLQAWSDAAVSMRRSLAAHLTAVSGMRWQSGQGGYATDFGLGGTTFYAVGTAAQVWSKTGAITPAALTATGQTIAVLRDRLRGAFDTAETSWATWQPQ